MFTMLHQYPVRDVVIERIPSLACAFVIADVFYKFHSFALECLAFLATWYILDGIWSVLAPRLRKNDEIVQ